MPRPAWGLTILLATGSVAPVVAQSMPEAVSAGALPLSTTLPPEPYPSLSRTLPPDPPAPLPPILGAPVGPADRAQTAASRTAGVYSSPAADLATTPVLNNDLTPRTTRGASLGSPVTTASMVDGGSVGYQPYPANPNPAYGQYPGQGYGQYPNAGYGPRDADNVPLTTDPNDFVRNRTIQVDQNYNLPSTTTRLPNDERQADKFGGEFGEKLEQVLGKRNEWFKSDHAFDGFISPMSNPFLFEDPRSLTEVRPIFEVDKLPSNNPEFKGGNTFFFGTQLRLAITDQLSFVINKLGGEAFNPGGGSPLAHDTGFAELWFGPKYTFIRSEATGSLLAGGLQFQVPIGSRGNYQDTGSLTLVPYVSYAQAILRDCSIGSINGMAGGGWAISVNGERSDYLYASGHVDWNVVNNNHWFPFLEATWYMYTTNGSQFPYGVEGLDLINFGGHAAGQGLLSGAIGTRYKFTENYQLGGAFDFPIAGPREVMSYGFTLDFILRY